MRTAAIALAGAAFLFSGAARAAGETGAILSAMAQGLPRDERQLTARAEGGDISAMIALAELSLMKNDHGETAKWFRRAADAGSVEAMVRLHDTYGLDFQGQPGADAESRRWMETAKSTLRVRAAKGDVLAERHLAYLCDLSDDGDEALSWYRDAAARGSPEAMQELGVHYELGEYVPADPLEAGRWFSKAAALGDVRAMRELSDAYDKGNGVALDKDKAREWSNKANAQELTKAEAGDQNAMLAVASRDLYQAEPRKPEEGIRLLTRAAGMGNWQAAVTLAIAYKFGRGVEKNEQLAAQWSEAATKIGMPLDKFDWPDQ